MKTYHSVDTVTQKECSSGFAQRKAETDCVLALLYLSVLSPQPLWASTMHQPKPCTQMGSK